MQSIPTKIFKNFPPRYSEISIISKPVKFFKSFSTRKTNKSESARIYMEFKIEALAELSNIICGKLSTR